MVWLDLHGIESILISRIIRLGLLIVEKVVADIWRVCKQFCVIVVSEEASTRAKVSRKSEFKRLHGVIKVSFAASWFANWQTDRRLSQPLP